MNNEGIHGSSRLRRQGKLGPANSIQPRQAWRFEPCKASRPTGRAPPSDQRRPEGGLPHVRFPESGARDRQTADRRGGQVLHLDVPEANSHPARMRTEHRRGTESGAPPPCLAVVGRRRVDPPSFVSRPLTRLRKFSMPAMTAPRHPLGLRLNSTAPRSFGFKPFLGLNSLSSFLGLNGPRATARRSALATALS